MDKCEGCGKFFLPSVPEEASNIKVEPDDVLGTHETKNAAEHIIKIEPEDNVVGQTETPEHEVSEARDGKICMIHQVNIMSISVTYDTKEDDHVPTTQENNQGDDPPRQEVMDAPKVNGKRNGEKGKKRAREDDQKGTVENDEKIAREDCPRGDNPRGEQGKDCSSTSSKIKREQGTDWYGVELFRSGVVQQPKNPYFVTKKRKNRQGELFIPTEIIKVFKLELPDEIKLIDSNERQFHVTRKTWLDGRTLYAGGWKALCAVNFVKDDDAIICEFVNNGSDLCIRVSIVKSNEQQS